MELILESTPAEHVLHFFDAVLPWKRNTFAGEEVTSATSKWVSDLYCSFLNFLNLTNRFLCYSSLLLWLSLAPQFKQKTNLIFFCILCLRHISPKFFFVKFFYLLSHDMWIIGENNLALPNGAYPKIASNMHPYIPFSRVQLTIFLEYIIIFS